MHWLFQDKKIGPVFLFKDETAGQDAILTRMTYEGLFSLISVGFCLLILKKNLTHSPPELWGWDQFPTLCYKHLLMTPKALANTEEHKIWDEWEACTKQKLQTFRKNFSVGISESPVTHRWSSHGQWGSQNMLQQDQNISMIPVLF